MGFIRVITIVNLTVGIMPKREIDSNSDDEMNIYDSSYDFNEQREKMKNTKSNPSLPGRAPRRPDSQLTPDELERRNRRRQCNREAANRQRDRRVRKVESLEEQVGKLKNEKEKLTDQNNELKEEVKKLKFQLGMKQPNKNIPVTLSPTHLNQPMQLMQPVQYVQTMPQMMVPLTPTNLVFADPNSDLNFTEQNFQFPTAKIQRLSSGAADSLFSHIC